MKTFTVLLFALITLIIVINSEFCLTTTTTTASPNINNVESSLTTRIPKLFNFDTFKKQFNKQYGSFLEELSRKRIFLGRAFKAFLSYIAYKHKKVTCHMKIHENSDWTQDEMRSIETKQTLSEFYNESSVGDKGDNKKDSVEQQTIADLDDIEKELNIIDEHKDEQGYKEIADELSKMEKINDNTKSKNFQLPGAQYLKSTVGNIVKKFVNLFSPHNQSKSDNTDNDNDDDGQKKNESNDVIEKNNNVIHVDHRDCLMRVKHQSKCGSCYIHTTIALYEWLYCKENKGEKVAFSEQFVLDCGSRVNLKGCSGGVESVVANDFISKYGLESRPNYPYRKRADTCPYDKYTGHRKMGYMKVNQVGMISIKYEQLEEYVNKGVVIMGILISDLFHNYGSGIDSGTECDSKRKHSVLIVGSGQENGIDYWLMRNSYGRSWGEEGYYRLAKKAKHCLMEGGKGFLIKPVANKNMFFKNESYDIEPIRKRYLDYKNGILVMPDFSNKNSQTTTDPTVIVDSATPKD